MMEVGNRAQMKNKERNFTMASFSMILQLAAARMNKNSKASGWQTGKMEKIRYTQTKNKNKNKNHYLFLCLVLLVRCYFRQIIQILLWKRG